MLAHLPIIILTSLHPAPVADSVPKFEIARECQFEGGTKAMQERCAADENQARSPVLRGNQHGQHSELRGISDLPRNGKGCEERPEVIARAKSKDW
jgi:hypothetical protein